MTGGAKAIGPPESEKAAPAQGGPTFTTRSDDSRTEHGTATGLRPIRGLKAIALYVGMPTREVAHLDRQRRIPIMIIGGVHCATAAALDDWAALIRAGLASHEGRRP